MRKLVLASESNSNKHDTATNLDTEKREGLLGERSEPVLVNSMAILFVCFYVKCHQPTAVSAHASPRNAQT